MSGLIKRSISLSGHATSLALEPEFWVVLDAEAARRGVTLSQVLAELDRGRAERPLASACRVAALVWVRPPLLPAHPGEGRDPSDG